MNKVSVFLIDDHAVLRHGLRMLLDAEPGLRVLAEAGSVPLVLQEVRTHRPDVLVLDLNMPGGSSIEAIGRIRRFSPRTEVVVLTMEQDRHYVHAAYEAGARAYVAKESAATLLVEAIRQAARPAP